MKKKEGPQFTKMISIRADEELYEKVRWAAYKTRHSMGGYIRDILTRELENESPALDSEGGNNVEATVSGS